MNFDYQKICENFLFDLPDKMRDIIERRFGFDTNKKETLELIGKSYGITRERVRQIEEDALFRVKGKLNTISQKPFQYFIKELKKFGGLKREDSLLEELGGKNFAAQVLFLLFLDNRFKRFSETENFYSLWTIDIKSLNRAKRVIKSYGKELEKKGKPLALENSHILHTYHLTAPALFSHIEISKQIMKGQDGLYGFSNWPEINPRGIKDKAFLILKKENKPMHFIDIADFVKKQEQNNKPSLVKTVHNELIKDPRFVLVGRGLYALHEWGYEPGCVKDIIFSVLKKARKPLTKETVIGQVLKQRFVKENTVFLNLNDKKCFHKNDDGKYTVREA